MRKRVICTTIGLTTLAVGSAGVYSYLNPNVLPEDIQQFLQNNKLLNEPFKNLPTKIEPLNLYKIENIKQPINDDSLSPKLLLSPVVPEKPADPVKPIDIKKKVEELQVIKPLTQKEQAAQLADLDDKIMSALEKAQASVIVATNAKYKTIQAIKDHSEALKKAVDSGQSENWTSVNEALIKSDNLSEKDIFEESTSRNLIDQLRKIIENAKQNRVFFKSRLVMMASESVNKMCYQLDEINNLIKKERLNHKILNNYQDLIEKSRKQFALELRSIVPGLDSGIKEGKLSNEERDALLAHAYIRIDQIRQQLIEQQVREEQNITNAIIDQQKANEKIAKAELDLELRHVRENVNLDIEKKVQDERKIWELELEASLQRASLAHTDNLESVIRTQKQLHDIENDKLVEEAVNKERAKFKKEVEINTAILNGIEHALQKRSAFDTESRRAKQYWLACQNLKESICYGVKSGVTFDARKKPLINQLKVIKEACENDDFVQSIINLYPKVSLEQGVYTEEDLKNRFAKIYKLGKHTAKVDENGGGLLKYAMSFAQSFFIYDVPRHYSPEDKLDLDSLPDTYELLARAKYYVDHNDFASAIRIVQLLDGQPARLAHDWIADARTHLETRFLTQLLIAHATVTSIRCVY